MDGILNIDKPAGITSHDVVAQVRRVLRQKRVGHAGTLDPQATGVLLICIGTATRIADLLVSQGKEYRAVLVLGTSTTTEDADGTIVEQKDASKITKEQIEAVLPRFRGEIAQVPPMVSALHHEGRRLYDLARAGVVVERAARSVRIDRLEMMALSHGKQPMAALEVECGKGTYIRTLCADIGAALEVGGHMASLRRTRVGVFRVEHALSLDSLSVEIVANILVSAASALRHLPEESLETDDDILAVRQGRSLATTLADAPVVRVMGAAGRLLALATTESGRLYPKKVFL